MKAIFSLEDAFLIKNRGVVLTGRIKEGEFLLNDFIIINGVSMPILGIERFRKMMSGAGEGDNVGILIGNLTTKDEMNKMRGQNFEITNIHRIREKKLNQLGI